MPLTIKNSGARYKTIRTKAKIATNNIFLNRQSNTPINFIGINNMINQNNQFPLNFFQQFNNYQYANNFKKGK